MWRCVVEKNKLVPAELRGVIDRETFDKARAYAIDKGKFGLAESIYSQILGTGVMVYGGLPWLWDTAGSTIAALGFEPDNNEILQTIAFLTICNGITSLLNLPWSAYFTFKIEQKHGFNKQTPGFFIKDKLKKLALTQIISAPVVAGLVYIIKVKKNY
ncbi:hypothetical protein HAZT_HAZT007932 [Hyalella azteca]|uniref:CAAX prenyl protease 1 N-terminal domain-containing protein n=1 Tax=Hyalella azteca TaxID=294128 RepID=A0A6A0GV92_HYAAZ|nr:hypothetical protein HAZT_HAZT007932 [Hyalella azteca]